MIKQIKKLLKNEFLALAGIKYGTLKRRKNIKKPPVKLYWWHNHESGIMNFGDEVTKDIMLKIFGYRHEYADIDDAELIGAGSIIEIAQNRKKDNLLQIWGSGYMFEDSRFQKGNTVFHAVRGELSRSRIEINQQNIPLGDPGLLANIVYQKSKNISKKIGVVVHYADNDHPLVKKLENDKRFKIISPLDTPENVANHITSCKMVLSSSLHGLIFADSFDIPNKHIRLTENVVGGSHKFRDYYSATGRVYEQAVLSEILNSQYLAKIHKDFVPVKNLYKIQKRLVKSFPAF